MPINTTNKKRSYLEANTDGTMLSQPNSGYLLKRPDTVNPWDWMLKPESLREPVKPLYTPTSGSRMKTGMEDEFANKQHTEYDTQETDAERRARLKELPSKIGGLAVGLAKPASDIARYALARKSIDRLANIRKRRQLILAPRTNLSVQAAQDLPPEVLAQYTESEARVRPGYKGSDLGANLIANQMASDQREKIRNAAAVARGSHLVGERNRVAQQEREGQMLAGQEAARDAQARQQHADYLTEVDASRETGKGQLTDSFIAGLGKTIGDWHKYNLTKKSVESQNDLTRLEFLLSKENQDLNAAGIPKNPERIKELQLQISKLYKTKMPGYFGYKCGGQLIPRKRNT